MELDMHFQYGTHLLVICRTKLLAALAAAFHYSFAEMLHFTAFAAKLQNKY